MANLVVVFACLGVGWGLGFVGGALPTRVADLLNWIALRFSLPCLAFRLLQSLGPFENLSSALLPAAMSWIVFAGSLVYFFALARIFKWTRGTLGALVLATGFGNTSFVGFPLLSALRGPGALRIGVIADQFGTFLSLATVGLTVAAILGARKPEPLRIGLRILTFPPFVAVALGLSMRGFSLPEFLSRLLEWGGATLAPFALLSVGLHLGVQLSGTRGREVGGVGVRAMGVPIVAGLCFKLLIAPIGIAVLYLGVLGARGEVAGVSVLEAAMAPMVTSVVIAREENLAPELAGLLIGVGIPLSLLTVPCWDWILRRLGA